MLRRAHRPGILLICVLSLISAHAPRPRRSLAPFSGAGGSLRTEMSVTRDHWHCGSDDGHSKDYTYKQVEQNCPSLAASLNHCCAVHDDCYGQQLGQEECDKQFCECNRLVARLPTEESFKCRGMLSDACLVLQLLGHLAYGNSNYTDPTKPSNVIPVVPKTVPEIKHDYLKLYETCPFVNITLASCSYNFDLCADVHSVDFCANDLCNCMLDAAEMDPIHKKQCMVDVTHTCRKALTHSTEIMTQRSNTKFNMILLTIFLFAAGATALIGFTIYKRSLKPEKKDGKLMHIHSVESSKSVNPLLLNTD
ncbi:unnamed protein product [Caenorhabditis bovis]|uniref:Domain of unknown function DB domain-containing protein n=1 Tax=Caenorhabditis bovis TaxID=2654633 RepID=A0A8S1FCT3_9PELO|nr:unnamed protein product [Caenorhabditis bovis]